jgi:hypothetical protein
MSPFEHKMPLGIISFTAVHSKSPKLEQDFIKTFNKTFSVENKYFFGVYILIPFQSRTVPFHRRTKPFAQVQYRSYLVPAIFKRMKKNRNSFG